MVNGHSTGGKNELGRNATVSQSWLLPWLMEFFSGDAQILISVVSGLFGGAVGGVATAGAIAVRGAKAQDRYRATATVRGVLNSYRALLMHDHDEAYRVDRYSQRYAGYEGQLDLAKSVLVELPELATLQRKRIREGLSSLVGKTTLGLAEKRAYLPEGISDPEDETKRRGVEILKALNEDKDAKVTGLLSELVRTQNDSESHAGLLKQTLATLDDMLKTVAL